jgi:5,10-methylenetetrahydromethanopterin reductase
VSWAASYVRQVREEAGLDPDGVAIGSYVNVVCHPDVDVARSMVAGGLATFARFSVMDGEVRTPVDAAQQKVLIDLHGAYDMHHHTEVGSPQTEQMPADFVDRFGVVGPPEHCVERLRELASFGIDRVAVSGPTAGADRNEARAAVTRFTEEVIPALRAG